MNDDLRKEARVSFSSTLDAALEKIDNWEQKNIEELLKEYGQQHGKNVVFSGETSKYMMPGFSIYPTYVIVCIYKGNDKAATNLQISIAFVYWVNEIYEKQLPDFPETPNEMPICSNSKIDENNPYVKEAKKLLSSLEMHLSQKH